MSKMEKEYIICSAVHFKLEDIFEHQPKNIASGFVVCGRRHHNCYNVLANIGKALELEERVRIIISKGEIRECQGFLTNTDRFVDRKEGAVIAHNANQLLRPDFYEEGYVLTSEDLY